MAIYRLLEHAHFNPEQITVLTAAYEHCLKTMGLVDRNDPVTELIAHKILEVAQRGDADPHRLCDQAMTELGIPPRAH